MSKFEVEIRTIEEVISHPNADRLIIYKLKDLAYQFISNVTYEVGHQVVYFPVDSVMTPELIELFELGNMLAGKQHNRVKTVKLRKEMSQGFIADINCVAEYLKVPPTNLTLMNLTETLGVTKYEPEPVICQNGTLLKLPPMLSMYDIESCDNYPMLVEYLIKECIAVTITEKLEGQNFSVTATKDETFVSQRNFTIEEKEGSAHSFWEVARKEGIIELAQKIREEHDAEDVTIYGEHCGPGVQGNYYKLPDRTVYFFDMKMNGKWVNTYEFLKIIRDHDMGHKLVPILGEGVFLDEWLAGQPMNKASYGKSVLCDRLREGIVIKPMVEMTAPNGIGRFIIKQRDPAYLDKTDF